MTDIPPANRHGGWWARFGRAPVVMAALAIVIFDLWLISNQEIIAAPWDDDWFMQRARCGYWFDEGYESWSFIKEPIYPLFAAVCYRLGWPLRLANEAVYLAAAGFLSWSLVLRQSPAAMGLLVFAAIALNPRHFLMLSRMHPNALMVSLLMFALGALLRQFKLRNDPGCWGRRLVSGLALGLLWNTRPENPWLMAMLLVWLTATAVRDWRRHPTWGVRIRSWLGAWILPLGVLLAVTVALMAGNYWRWGVFAVTAMRAPGFTAAQRALMSIEQEHPVHQVPVTREALRLGYAVSPSLREAAADFEGAAESQGPEWHGEIGAGQFFWVLHDAAESVGHGKSATEAEEYFHQIAGEINAAAAEGRLATRWVPLTSYAGIDPCLDNWLPELLPSFCRLWPKLWIVDYPEYLTATLDSPDAVNYPGDLLQAFDEVACRRDVNRAPGVRSRIREVIYAGYGSIMNTLLANAGLVALAVVLLWRTVPGAGAYLLTGAALGLAGFLQFGFVTVVDAALFECGPGYVFTAAVLLTGMAAWLLADGIRLLSGAVTRSFQATSAEAQREGLRRWLASGKRNTCLVVGLTGTAVVFLSINALHDLYNVYNEASGPEPGEAATAYHEVPVSVVPVAVHQMDWKDGTGRGYDPYLVFAVGQTVVLGRQPRLTYPVKQPRAVAGIRLRYVYEQTIGPAFCQLFWRTSDRNDFDLDNRWSYHWLETGPGEHTTTFWIKDTLDQFRLHPHNKSCVFTLLAITLVVEDGETEPATAVLATPYARARAATPITVATFEDKAVLRVDAPSSVEFDVPARAQRSRIVSKYGILPGAPYGNPRDHTDGVQFAVEYTPEGKSPVVLFTRFLDPHDNERDRGMHGLAAWLPPGDKGTVVFKTFNPPGKSDHLDWSYWTDVEIDGVHEDVKRWLKTPFVTPFARAQAAEPPTMEFCDGKAVLRVHAPSAVDFDVPPRLRRTRVTGKFGILPGAYGQAEDHTDGVQFAVEYTPEGKSPVVLFERFLDPQDNPQDRGMHDFAVWLTPGGPGTVALKAFNPPGRNEHLDWSYWTDVEIGSPDPGAPDRPQATGPSPSDHIPGA
jgi:hypothetical protein